MVEDTDVTLDFIECFFGQEIAQAVNAITKRDGEWYDDYLTRVMQDEIAKRVKVADVAENLREDRPFVCGPLQRMKYRTAMRTLMGEY